jgi:hypothetical protein
MRRGPKPNYLDWRPPNYQVLGPEQEETLDRILVTYPDDQGTTMDPLPTARFWVRTPQVRCRVRVVVFAKPDQPAGVGNPTAADPDADPITDMYVANVSGELGLLWVAEHERGNGSGLKASPVRNVVGTAAAPLSIPTDARLWGYAFEVETNGTELYGEFTPPNNAVGGALCPSRWHVVVRYESVVPVSDEEWNQFLGKQFLRVSPQEGVTVEGGGGPP